MEWWPFLIFHRGGLRIKVINNTRHPQPRGRKPALARNTLDSTRIPRASKLLICGLFQKGRVLAQNGVHWHNTQRLFEPIGNVAPVEYEMNYYRSQEGSLEMARLN